MLTTVFVLVLYLAGHVLADSLYEGNDAILELDTDTFDAAVYGSKKAHFVEFYSSWCGACIGYAPTFKKFARELSDWSPILQVTTVNCADDKNMPLCRKHSVQAYPTLKYFKFRSLNQDDGMTYRGDKYALERLEQDVAGLVQADQQRQNPENWPNFLPVAETSTLEDMFKSISGTPYFAVVIQENPATFAWANMINYHGNAHVKVASMNPTHPVATKFFGHEANNRALLFATGSSLPVWTSPEIKVWQDIQNKINETISHLANSATVAAEAPIQLQSIPVRSGSCQSCQQPKPVRKVTAPNSNLKQYEVQLVDLQSAMSYMLYKEIPRRQEIVDEPLAALKQWIHVLKKYAPGTTPMRRLFFRIDEWLQLLPKVTADEWIAKVDELQQALGNPLSKEIHWIACNGSKPNLRGYTCGLWTLAHTVSVEAYKAEKNNALFKPVIDVLEPFRAFVFHFLSCSECAQNFAKEAEKNQLHLVTRPEDVYGWLWKVHNFVNQRLSGSPSDDPSYPKQQFPPKSLCPQCYSADGTIDEEKTLPFVLQYYSDIKHDTIEPPPGYKVTEYKDGKMLAAGQRHLNPKFAIHAQKIDKMEAAEKMKGKINANPERDWKAIEGLDNFDATVGASRAHLYFIWLSIIGCVLIFVYCKYRRNRSKFWKTFYYHNDFKL